MQGQNLAHLVFLFLSINFVGDVVYCIAPLSSDAHMLPMPSVVEPLYAVPLDSFHQLSPASFPSTPVFCSIRSKAKQRLCRVPNYEALLSQATGIASMKEGVTSLRSCLVTNDCIRFHKRHCGLLHCNCRLMKMT